MIYFAAKDVEIIDAESVGGMRGTGSHDFAVRDLFVPAGYALNAMDDPPLHPGPLDRLSVTLTFAPGLAPLSLGLARGAVDCFVELMETRVDRLSGTSMRDRLTVQERVANAEAIARSARALRFETAVELWEVVRSEGRLTERQHALVRLALMHAVASASQAVDIVYHAAGRLRSSPRSSSSDSSGMSTWLRNTASPHPRRCISQAGYRSEHRRPDDARGGERPIATRRRAEVAIA